MDLCLLRIGDFGFNIIIYYIQNLIIKELKLKIQLFILINFDYIFDIYWNIILIS